MTAQVIALVSIILLVIVLVSAITYFVGWYDWSAEETADKTGGGTTKKCP